MVRFLCSTLQMEQLRLRKTEAGCRAREIVVEPTEASQVLRNLEAYIVSDNQEQEFNVSTQKEV